jgi:hypothetical protein
MKDLTLVMMVGPLGAHPLERTMRFLLRVAARETLSRIMSTGRVARAVLAAPDLEGLESMGRSPLSLEIDLDSAGQPFDFGSRLSDLIVRYRISRLLYVGAGASPLMTSEDWDAALGAFQEMEEGLLTNNLHSSDWIALAPAEAVRARSHRFPTDNALAWVLHREGELPARVWPRSTASLLDLDTPVDALIVARHPMAPPVSAQGCGGN